ncbi:Ribokinase [Nakaseomyces bracarensis]|uniref:Ribokinase n=1 Tax=Nakaseomyces bracarensis TaxID=273131 RepID=A0ABR4NYK5_9SACH
MGITVIGSLNYDLVTYTDAVPDGGETIRANSFETHTGGKGCNQCIAIGRLRDPKADYKVKMVGNVGQDSFGEQLMGVLKEEGVDVSDVGQLEGVSTGTATILVEESKGGQNRILIVKGANGKSEYTPDQLNDIFKSTDDQEYVVFQQEIPNADNAMNWIHHNIKQSTIVFNPSPFQSIKNEHWSAVDVLVVNEIEALQVIADLEGEKLSNDYKANAKTDFIGTYEKIAEHLQKNIVNQRSLAAVIVTLGSRGVLFTSKQHPKVEYMDAIHDIKVVDSTGAGDTFLGAVVTQLYEGKSLQEAVRFATLSSSLAIQKNGAAESIPKHNDVLKLAQ